MNAIFFTGSSNVTLADAITTPVDCILPAGNYDTVTLEIFGTATDATINFKASFASGTYIDYNGLQIPNYASGTVGTIGQVWQFDIEGIETLMLSVVSVTGGNLSIKGKVN